MLIIGSIALVFMGWRLGLSLVSAVRQVPRSNDDMIFF